AKPAAAPARQVALPLAPAGAGVSMQVAVDQTDFEFAYYLQAVRTAIGQAWAAPAGAASGARCTVYFRIGRDGSIEAVRLEAGSGNGFFDQAAVRAVVVTAKLPPLPLGYTGADLGIHLDFVYTGP
ncbi:MAG TPA: TonB family protein, partial [Candidatus Eisenbacteria bacterium]|nr:TonB family protein [Candidatus Eisenbacteria bacterium]